MKGNKRNNILLFMAKSTSINMKQLFIIIIFFLSNAAPAQTFPDTLIPQGKYIYNNHKDTITLTNVNTGYFNNCDNVKIIDSIQIDGKGSKELVFFRHCSGFYDDHGGTFDMDESTSIGKYEIWDIDAKKLLFEAVNYYKFVYNNSFLYSGGKRDMHIQGKGFYNYTYSFVIDMKGKITIKDIKTNNLKDPDKADNSLSSSLPAPDHQQGVYNYVDGAYKME